jgi:hypothetical protein
MEIFGKGIWRLRLLIKHLWNGKQKIVSMTWGVPTSDLLLWGHYCGTCTFESRISGNLVLIDELGF